VINLVVADDSDVMLRSVRHFLAGDARFCVVGETVDYAKAVQLVEELRPDLLLADLRMPGVESWAEPIRDLVTACGCPVIGMSFSVDDEIQELAKSVGVSRLLDKTKLFDTLIPAIESVLAAQRKAGPR
jgi:DNA-binding NarL/FixJ family response regulator